MTDNGHGDVHDGSERPPEHVALVYGRAIRTALGNNATAYGFSISITAAYGLLSGPQSSVSAAETVSFALGAAVAFTLIGAVSMVVISGGRLGEDTRIATISGAVDIVSIGCAIATAFGLSQLPSSWAWALTGGGTVTAYLVVGGLDVLVARTVAQRSSFGRRQ